uniref:Uncharacterized protein n=1 Tax=Triticum urartu TaxID=4572 RepID=A0A8R7Q4M4_TRIUA
MCIDYPPQRRYPNQIIVDTIIITSARTNLKCEAMKPSAKP